MFKIESYVTPILLSYVDKYVRDFKPADAQVSLWGGGVALHNLVLKPDVLQQEVALPFTLVSGRIHELLIQVPWTKIMSEPIIVTIDTIECILSLNPPTPTDEATSPETSCRKTQMVEAPPGYMQALVRRIVSNISLRVHHLIVKYVQDDVVLSLNVKHLSIDSTGADWKPSFADIDQKLPMIRRLMKLDDLTLCLDRCDSDGKIRFYQEPLLYRCQLDLRVLTRLVSANTRRASCLSLQLRSSKLAWGVTSDQLILLLRLLRERNALALKMSASGLKSGSVKSIHQSTPLFAQSQNSAEPARRESWSEWAWSWLPAWSEGDVDKAHMPATPTPVYFTAYCDDISVVFKVMEVEGGNRKRTRGILELSALHAALKGYVCVPTTLRYKLGVRSLLMRSHGKCVCGHIDINAANEEPTIYLSKQGNQDDNDWKWPDDYFDDLKIETATAVDEEFVEIEASEEIEDPKQAKDPKEETADRKKEAIEETDKIWEDMNHLIYINYTHERSPPTAYTSPYDNPPIDFEYSDWGEECKFDIQFQPIQLRLCMGLIHRFQTITSVLKELPPVPDEDLQLRTLTVEECDALLNNLPQLRVNMEIKDLRLRLHPWDHSVSDRPVKWPLLLDIEVSKGGVVITSPLYPYRVCSAACQMPDDTSLLSQGARLHVTAAFTSVEAKINSPIDAQPKLCARTDLRIVLHVLLNRHLFTRPETVLYSHSLKIREANVAGSAARLQAASQILTSLATEKVSLALKHTSLAKDALKDEKSVALDLTVEDLTMRGFITTNTNTHIMTLQSVRVTAFHSPEEGVLKQAWVFSAPDIPSTTPYLRTAVQWCWQQSPTSMDYVGAWTEPAALCIDPLFIAWLAYKPRVKPIVDAQLSAPLHKTISTSQYFMRRRGTPPSSSGRGGSRSGSGTEFIHVRPRSVESSSEPSEKKDPKPSYQKPNQELFKAEDLLKFQDRLRNVLITMEFGLVLVYVTMSTASALDCATVVLAMEQHASALHRVLVLSLGRWHMHSNVLTKQLWEDIKYDGPTFMTEGNRASLKESFPWKAKFADVSCYTLEVSSNADYSGATKGLRSQLKSRIIQPRTILELVTTTVTMSVVTKSVQYRTYLRKPAYKKAKDAEQDGRMKYFTSGTNFKPTTLKEFVRGPASRKKPDEKPEEPEPSTSPTPDTVVTPGPVVAVGINLHVDTPPVSVKLDHDQIHVVAATVHCFTHIVTLLRRDPLVIAKSGLSSQSLGGKIKSVCEIDEQSLYESENDSENKSEFISIFQAHPDKDNDPNIITFLWFQWVISRATVMVAADQAKLAFQIEDIITSLDLQHHYNQLKIKIGSASVRHFKKTESEDWTAGVLGGRVLEAREPSNDREDTHFLAVTVTQALISNLPSSWKNELHPKILEQKDTADSMWEVYAMLAPLEAILQPEVFENIMSFAHEMAPRSFCPLQTEVKSRSPWQWPFCYINAGGLRLLVTSDNPDKTTDDTFMVIFGRTSINPHPENPICRRPVNSGADSGWHSVGGGYEGRQYEILVKSIAVHTAHFAQLVLHEESVIENSAGMGGENPARKWSQPVVKPDVTPVIRTMDVNCVLAPALFLGGSLVCGPGVEFNLLSDCSIELSIEQLELIHRISIHMKHTFRIRQESSMVFDDNKGSVCPYGTLLISPVPVDDASSVNDSSASEADIPKTPKTASQTARSVAEDSGVDTVTSRSTLKSPHHASDDGTSTRKSVSMALFEVSADPRDYIELFVTMGTIDISLYTTDDNSPEVAALRPEGKGPRPIPEIDSEEFFEDSNTKEPGRTPSKRPLDPVRQMDLHKCNFELRNAPQSKKLFGSVPLIHMTLYQPNLYYWRKKSQKSLQISLFNAWAGLGAPPQEDYWHAVLMSTARGVPDPVTEIPPALATMKVSLPATGGNYLGGTSAFRGTLRVDIERPVQFQVNADRLKRIKGILELVDSRVTQQFRNAEKVTQLPILYKLRRFMAQNSIETATIQTSQIGVSGDEGSAGWDSASLQAARGARPERLLVRSLVCAALVAAGGPEGSRHVVLQPVQLGFELEATWEGWRRAEGGLSSKEPTVYVAIEVDNVTIDLRPVDLSAIARIRQTLLQILDTKDSLESAIPGPSNGTDSVVSETVDISLHSSVNFEPRRARSSIDSTDTDHYYKDDLRSGAFKIVSGGQLPMAYQVTLHGDAVSWRYPHPRAITRLITFPLPGHDTEIDCVLEMFNEMLDRWEPHTYFKLPVSEPEEIKPYVPPPGSSGNRTAEGGQCYLETVFATTWRIRVYSEIQQVPYKFCMGKFMPQQDSLASSLPQHPDLEKTSSNVTAEELSGVLRVDSYFAPRLLPRLRITLQLAVLEVHAHNAMLSHLSPAPDLEGYYISKPQMQSHRVLSVNANQTTMYAAIGSAAGKLMLLKTSMLSNILDCSTGTMEQLVDEFRLQAGLSLPRGSLENSRLRFRASSIRTALHVPRLRTLQALAMDWKHGLDQMTTSGESYECTREVTNTTISSLEGRVSLWIHNSCLVALRVGQEGTDEVLPLVAGAKLAYRWRHSTGVRKLRFALASPSVDWHWSEPVSFTTHSQSIRLEDADCLGDENVNPAGEVYLHVDVEQTGSIKSLRLSGRLLLANMLRMGLMYKVRMRLKQQSSWCTVSSGELEPETVSRSVLCGSNCEMILKIRLANHETGWSGDIPLRECPKVNVPWLVKVPSVGQLPYISVWCRVTRARSDRRILATVWPLYVLHSQLPLDTDVQVSTETDTQSSELHPAAPLIQSAKGRGSTTHILAPGTTAARHSLFLQYRNIESPVTHEAVPLHYGVTNTSVFENQGPISRIEDVLDELKAWLQRSSRDTKSTWPYSVVATHWAAEWQPALLQPRCDVTVRYQAVRAGGGCSLEVRLSPVVLLCNATLIALTLRAHDAAPLCKLEPGTAISPSTAMLRKPFFMSVEIGRETFVSGQLQVSSADPGRYGAPPPGQVALDHPAHFAVQCNHKVALFTLYYEIKEDINILGITSTFLVINKLKTNILVSAIAVPGDTDKDLPLYPKTFKVLQPTMDETLDGTPLSRFWVRDRWRGGDVSQLNLFLCAALPAAPASAGPAATPVPVRLGLGRCRRALALVDQNQHSVAVVVTQHKHEGRWLVTLAHDPCPQFVVHNRTRHGMAVAQCARLPGDEPAATAAGASYYRAVAECAGARWWCAVGAGALLHYSTPEHCARHPAAVAPPQPVPFLTFSRLAEGLEPDWCAPVAVTDGEQLVQLSRGVTVKMRVRSHPHSALLELQDVEQTDISASDIRRRLIGPFPVDESNLNLNPCITVTEMSGSHALERVGAEAKLLPQTSQHSAVGPTQDKSRITAVEIYSETSLASSLPGSKRVLASDKTGGTWIETGDIVKSGLIEPNKEHSGLATSSAETIARPNLSSDLASFIYHEESELATESVCGVIENIAVEIGATDCTALLAMHFDRASLSVSSHATKTIASLAIADVQVDNLQYDSGQYDFAVVATTRAESLAPGRWPALWNMFAEQEAFDTRQRGACFLLNTCHDKWEVVMYRFHELTEVDLRLGPIALYVEDAYVRALLKLFRLTVPPAATTDASNALSEAEAIQCPLRLRLLHIHAVDVTLTLHTAVRMYIALDQSPLHLSAFKLQNMMLSMESLVHALTVHYLSAAILGAGWVVGGLELLGAPGALAARVSGASGGVRGVASAAAAGLLRSFSACAGSLARNLDLLAGDAEHALRAAAARRRPPNNLAAGLVAGITNFAINILGAVGGLAHHPLVSVAVGEAGGAAALRRGLVGALAKPLSATADLLAYAGHGLLNQTGWDPVPQPRVLCPHRARVHAGWRRDCVRWAFRFAELSVLAGFRVLLNNAHLELLLTHKFIVVADPESERVVEMIDLRFCTLNPYQGTIVELCVSQRRTSKVVETVTDEDDEYQISAAAMDRVARYTGAASEGCPGEARLLSLLPAPGHSHALHAALATLIHHNSDSYFPLL